MGGKPSLTSMAHDGRMLASIRLLWCAAICCGLIAPARACIDLRGPDWIDVRYADLVLVGRVQNYRIVRDELERQAIRRLSKDPVLGYLVKRDLERVRRGERMSGDYAKFDVLVHRRLLGTSPAIVTVAWSRPHFFDSGAMPSGPYVIAMRSPHSVGSSEARYQDADLRSREPSLPTVLTSFCGGPFMFKVNSHGGKALMASLSPSDAGEESDTLPWWLFLGGIAAANLGLLWFGKRQLATH